MEQSTGARGKATQLETPWPRAHKHHWEKAYSVTVLLVLSEKRPEQKLHLHLSFCTKVLSKQIRGLGVQLEALKAPGENT